MTKLVCKMTETDIISALNAWVSKMISQTTLNLSIDPNKLPETTLDALINLKFIPGLSGIVPKSLDTFKESLRSKLLSLGFALVRMDRFLNVLQLIKETLIKEVKVILRKVRRVLMDYLEYLGSSVTA